MRLKPRIIIIVALLILTASGIYGLWLKPSRSSQPLTSEELPDVTAVLSGLDVELVEYTDSLVPGTFHGPCPSDPTIQKDIANRFEPLGFGPTEDADKRQWKDILKRQKQSRSIDDIKHTLKTLLIEYYKSDSPMSGRIIGLSGTVDYRQQTRSAICDELSFIHHQVQGGIDATIDAVKETPGLIPLSDRDRQLLQTLYRSCKMTTLNAYRYSGLLTRVVYAPSPDDEVLINKMLDLDPQQPNVVICTYKEKENPSP